MTDPGSSLPKETPSYDWRGKRILVVAPEKWGSMRLSKHHYTASLIEAGAEVFYLEPYGAGDIKVLRSSNKTSEPSLVQCGPILRGLRFLPRPIRAFMEARRIAKIAKACGGYFDLLWNFDPYSFRSLTDRQHARARILHVMDLPIPVVIKDPAENADAIFVVSPRMLEGIDHLGHKSLHVPHGLKIQGDIKMFDRPLPNGPHIGYLGNLGIRYLDRQALLTIASAHPEATLHLMGPWTGAFGNKEIMDSKIFAQLKELPNVIFHGQISSEEIQEYLARMDILLIAYDTRKYPLETAHSHKVLEYLYSGRIILSSYMADYTEISDLMVMVPAGESIADHIAEVLRGLPELNTNESQQQRRAYAASMTYEQHLRKIAAHLAALGLQ